MGAVDPDVAAAMARGVADRLGADYGVATTGVAGPDPQDGHPVGEVWVAVDGPGPGGERRRRRARAPRPGARPRRHPRPRPSPRPSTCSLDVIGTDRAATLAPRSALATAS